MKMTFTELMAWPNGMSMEEYERQLEAEKKKAKRIKKLGEERDFLQDALEVLKDEPGSERYIKKARRLEKVEAEIIRLTSGEGRA